MAVIEVPILDRPHAEAREILASGVPVYLPINPVEYHGPHLSLHNDQIVSVGLIRELHERQRARHPDWPLVVARDLEVGVEPTPGPGSRPMPSHVVRRTIVAACDALANLGAQRVVLMTFHGNPLHEFAVEAGVRRLRKRNVVAVAPLNLLLQKMLALDPLEHAPAYEHVTDEALRLKLMNELDTDFHAGFFETSLALHFAPETVSPSYVDLPPCTEFPPDRAIWASARLAKAAGRDKLAGELRFLAVGTAWFALRPFPGYTGHPSLARPESGRFFAERIVGAYDDLLESVFFDGARSPEPIMRWAHIATLGGRLRW